MFEYGSEILKIDFHLHTQKDKEFSYNGTDFISDYVTALSEKDIQIGVITKNEAEFKPEITNMIKVCLNSLQSFFKCDVVVVGVGTVTEIKDIYQGYQKSITALEDRLVYGMNRIYYFSDGMDRVDKNILKEQREEKLLNLIKCVDNEGVMRIIDDIFKFIHQNSEIISTRNLKDQLIQLLKNVYNDIVNEYKVKKSIDNQMINFEQIEENIAEANNLDELRTSCFLN